MRFLLLTCGFVAACSAPIEPTASVGGGAIGGGAAIGGGGHPLACGDGVISGTEQCDDGNTTASDGCSSTCLIESGYSCVSTPSACCPVMPAGYVMGFDSDYMVTGWNNGGLANGDQLTSWKSIGLTGDATAASALNYRAAGAFMPNMETGHDAFYIGNAIVKMTIANSQTPLTFIPTTGIFDCLFAGRALDNGEATTMSIFADSAANNVLFYLNGSGANAGKMSVIMNGGAVLKNTGPTVTVGARSVMEWSGDGATISMRLNNGAATTVAYAGSTAPAGDFSFGVDPDGSYTSAMFELRAAYCYDTNLSAGDRTSATTALQCGMDSAARTVISAQGDSIVQLGANGVNKSWPQVLQASLNSTYPRTYLVGNSGAGGDKITNVSSRIVNSVVGRTNITKVVTAVGVNDCVGHNGTYAATVYGDTVTAGTYAYMIHQLVTDTPAKQVYATSITPFGGYALWDQDAQDCADNLDALVRANTEITGYVDTFVALRASSTGACAGAAGTSHTGACAMSTTTGCGGSSCDGTGESGVTADGLHPGIHGMQTIAATVQAALGL